MILALCLFCHLQTSPSAVPWMRRYSTFWKFFALAITVEFCWEGKRTVQQLQFKPLVYSAERLSLPSRKTIKQLKWHDSSDFISIWDYNRNHIYGCIYMYIYTHTSVSTEASEQPGSITQSQMSEVQQGKVPCPALGSSLCSIRSHVEGWLQSSLVEKGLYCIGWKQLDMSQCLPREPRRPEPSGLYQK